jgi:hypothetical protein
MPAGTPNGRLLLQKRRCELWRGATKPSLPAELASGGEQRERRVSACFREMPGFPVCAVEPGRR